MNSFLVDPDQMNSERPSQVTSSGFLMKSRLQKIVTNTMSTNMMSTDAKEAWIGSCLKTTGF